MSRTWSMRRRPTADGRWICDVCYAYEVCQEDPKRKGKGPCDEEFCEHRPKIVSKWTTKKEDDSEGT